MANANWGKKTRQIDAKNIKICIANVNWEKKHVKSMQKI